MNDMLRRFFVTLEMIRMVKKIEKLDFLIKHYERMTMLKLYKTDSMSKLYSLRDEKRKLVHKSNNLKNKR